MSRLPSMSHANSKRRYLVQVDQRMSCSAIVTARPPSFADGRRSAYDGLVKSALKKTASANDCFAAIAVVRLNQRVDRFRTEVNDGCE